MRIAMVLPKRPLLESEIRVHAYSQRVQMVRGIYRGEIYIRCADCEEWLKAKDLTKHFNNPGLVGKHFVSWTKISGTLPQAELLT